MSEGNQQTRGKSGGGRTFGSPLLATLRDAIDERVCRVCALPIARGEKIWGRAWHVEFAHEACGFVKRGEEAPHECRKPGSFSTYWEWKCPTCGLDACSLREPRANDPRDCHRCCPAPPLAAHVVVETNAALVVAKPLGRRVQRLTIGACVRGQVLECRDGRALVRWLDVKAPDVWVEAIVLRPLFRVAA